LAKKHNFLLIVDETIGNFCNVKLIDHCHLMVSSLTKVFSGDSNVMGGSLVINSTCPQAHILFQLVKSMYVDTVWGQDAIFLERNSRKFKQRIQIINENAEKLCDAIQNHPKGI
jgi:cystathionine gamma-synthase